VVIKLLIITDVCMTCG